MVDIRFEGDSAPVRPNLQNKDSKLTVFLINKSFGLIKTSQQAVAVQLVFIVVLLLTAMILFDSSNESNSVVAPSQELINARQPVGPLP